MTKLALGSDSSSVSSSSQRDEASLLVAAALGQRIPQSARGLGPDPSSLRDSILLIYSMKRISMKSIQCDSY